MSCIIKIAGPGTTFCFEAEVIKRALQAEGVQVEVETNYEYTMSEEDMNEARRRMNGDWSGGKEETKDQYGLGKAKRSVLIIEDHQPWGG